MPIIQISGRTKSGIFPLNNKGGVVAALWEEVVTGEAGKEKTECKPLAIQLIGRQPSRATGSELDKFEQGFYDIAGLWKMFQTDGFLLGTQASSPRFYEIGEQKKLPEAERWEVKKQESCVAWGAKVLAKTNELAALLNKTPGAEKTGSWAYTIWQPSEEKLDEMLRLLKIPESDILGREFTPSRYQKWLCTSPALKSGEYVYANTAQRAAGFFRDALKEKKICCPPEWQQHIWGAFEKRGWLVSLQGIGMAGFRLMNDPFQARMLIGRMIRNSFHPTDKGFDPDLPILPVLPGMEATS